MSKIKDKKLAVEFRKMPCFICGGFNQVSGHHIFTTGSHPELVNIRMNIIPLCFNHHRDAHDMDSREVFIQTYGLEEMMLRRGFEINTLGKWIVSHERKRELLSEA
jgi:hypothetical protein